MTGTEDSHTDKQNEWVRKYTDYLTSTKKSMSEQLSSMSVICETHLESFMVRTEETVPKKVSNDISSYPTTILLVNNEADIDASFDKIMTLLDFNEVIMIPFLDNLLRVSRRNTESVRDGVVYSPYPYHVKQLNKYVRLGNRQHNYYSETYVNELTNNIRLRLVLPKPGYITHRPLKDVSLVIESSPDKIRLEGELPFNMDNYGTIRDNVVFILTRIKEQLDSLRKLFTLFDILLEQINNSFIDSPKDLEKALSTNFGIMNMFHGLGLTDKNGYPVFKYVLFVLQDIGKYMDSHRLNHV